MSDTYGGGLYGGTGSTVTPQQGLTEIVLDPLEVAGARTALSLNAGAIRVDDKAPDWGDAQIEAYMAEQARGSLPVDFRIPNRTVTIPLLLGATDPAGYMAARANLHNKVALIQREGGWLRRGDGVYLDLVNATINTPDKWGWRQMEPEVTLTLEAIPDFYGDEIALGTHSETSLNEVVFVETGIGGDYPGRLRLVVTEADGNAQAGLIWGIRSRFYSSAPTARLAYAGNALTPVGTATVVSGSVVGIGHTNVGTTWTPVASTDLPSAGALTHVGSYRVFGRVFSPNGPAVATRLVWDVGDLTLPVENRSVPVPGTSGYYIVDFGSVRLDEPPVGLHRWGGQIQAKGTVGGEDFTLNRLWVVPADEGMGVLRASPAASSVFIGAQIRDDFTGATTGTPLSGRALPTGGQSWGGAGPTDFLLNSGYPGVTRQAIDTASGATNPGRFALVSGSGASLTDTSVQATFTRYGVAWSDQQVVARYTNSAAGSVRAGVSRRVTATGHDCELRLAYGIDNVLASVPLSIPIGTTWTVRLDVLADGRWAVWYAANYANFPSSPHLSGQDSMFATGGSLPSGQVGVYDATYEGSSNTLRIAQFFRAWAPEPADDVLHPNRSAELRWDGMYRETADGAAYGPVSRVVGDHPRIPPGGSEDRPVEFFVKASRGDIDQLPDPGVDDLTVRAFYRPSWLFKDDGG